ncbi:MAG: ATP-binding protein [Bacteroidota bacterium]
MIKTVSKTPVFRYSLIALLISCLSFLTIFLYLKYDKAQQLRSDVNKLVAIRENSSQIDDCILTLYSADNDSRLYGATGETRYLVSFSKQIKSVDSVLNRLREMDEPPVKSSSLKISNLMDRKNLKTWDYLRLRQLSDSLIGLSLANSARLSRIQKPDTTLSVPAHTPVLDTVIVPKKKSFFGKIAGLFSKKKADEQDTLLVASSAATSASVPMKPAQNKSYPNYYKKLLKASVDMQHKEREMLLINSGIIQELITVLKRYKAEEQQYVASKRTELRGTLETVFLGVTELSALTAVLVGLLLITLFYNLWKIFRHDRRIIAYSEEATQFAAEKTAFLANMSHEIRTPLNAIRGFAEQLEHSELNPEQEGQIKAVRSSADMLLNVVNQVLDFSKYEIGKMQFDHSTFLVNKVMSDITISMGMLAKQKDIKLWSELNYDQSLHLCGDAFRLRQVIMNLVGNAIKFTKEGEVVLKVSLTEDEGQDPILNVAVQDTGVGIKEAELPLIFKEFTQAGSDRKQQLAGTGLGLAISKSIVEQQGGTIQVTSELGKGSIFSFSIPFKSVKVVEIEKDRVVDEQELGEVLKDKRILLAEDNAMNVMLAKTILRKWHMVCDVAYNGREALTLFEKNDYDLILTDIHMPEMGGVELTTLIRQARDKEKASVPILALTASVMQEDHDLYMGCGINAIASKPFLEKELIQKIDLVIRSVAEEMA